MLGDCTIGDAYIDKLDVHASVEMTARTKIGAPLIVGKDYGIDTDCTAFRSCVPRANTAPFLAGTAVCEYPEAICEYLEVYFPINGHSDMRSEQHSKHQATQHRSTLQPFVSSCALERSLLNSRAKSAVSWATSCSATPRTTRSSSTATPA